MGCSRACRWGTAARSISWTRTWRRSLPPDLAVWSTLHAKSSPQKEHPVTYALWTVQILLALLYLFSGSMKLIMPIEEMTADIALPEFLLRFIGVAEILGGLGLALPGLF